MNLIFKKTGGSTRASRVISGVAPETDCGVKRSMNIRVSLTKRAQEPFGETPNGTRETRVLPEIREHRGLNFESN